MDKDEAENYMEDLVKEYDHQSRKLIEDVSEASSDISQKMMMLGSLCKQMEDVQADYKVRIPRKFEDVARTIGEALELAISGRYKHVAAFPRGEDDYEDDVGRKRRKIQ